MNYFLLIAAILLGVLFGLAAGSYIIIHRKESGRWPPFREWPVLITSLFAWWWMPWLFYMLCIFPWSSIPLPPVYDSPITPVEKP